MTRASLQAARNQSRHLMIPFDHFFEIQQDEYDCVFLAVKPDSCAVLQSLLKENSPWGKDTVCIFREKKPGAENSDKKNFLIDGVEFAFDEIEQTLAKDIKIFCQDYCYDSQLTFRHTKNPPQLFSTDESVLRSAHQAGYPTTLLTMIEETLGGTILDAEWQALLNKIHIAINNGKKIILSLDFDDTMILLSNDDRECIINHALTEKIALLINEFGPECFEFRILSSRAPDHLFHSSLQKLTISHNLPLFYDAVLKNINPTLKEKTNVVLRDITAHICCLRDPAQDTVRQFFTLHFADKKEPQYLASRLINGSPIYDFGPAKDFTPQQIEYYQQFFLAQMKDKHPDQQVLEVNSHSMSITRKIDVLEKWRTANPNSLFVHFDDSQTELTLINTLSSADIHAVTVAMRQPIQIVTTDWSPEYAYARNIASLFGTPTQSTKKSAENWKKFTAHLTGTQPVLNLST